MEPIEAAVIFASAHSVELAAALGVSLAGLAGVLGVATYVIVRLPEDYLDRPEDTPLSPKRPGGRRTLRGVARNLLGVAVIATGAVFAIPGVPGPGQLIILGGLMLLDFPAKRRVERRIVGAPKVLALANHIRARFSRPPLRIPATHHDATRVERSARQTA
jgi:hypothetical protein